MPCICVDVHASSVSIQWFWNSVLLSFKVATYFVFKEVPWKIWQFTKEIYREPFYTALVFV